MARTSLPSGGDTHPSHPGDLGHPTVFLPGEDKLPDGALQAISPRGLARGSHLSSASLSEALIMMVDDELLNIEMTEAFLSEAGYSRFVHTHDPEQALPMMRRAMPGVLLLDLSMPKVGGLEILASMREDPVLRHVPVIVLTGSTDPQVKLQALSGGAMDFLSKPVDPSELALRIRNTLAATAYRDYLANHDALTGLPNKLRYRKTLEAAMEEARQGSGMGAVLHVGVDRLGNLNDALGRAAGDQILQKFGKKLLRCAQTEAGGGLSSGQFDPTVFRFDGDEFAVLLPSMDGLDTAAAFISKVLDECTVSTTLGGGEEVIVTGSIGVAVFPQDGRDADLLMSNAGLALRHAKEAGRHRYEFFSQKLNEQAVRRLDLGADLRRAFGRGELEVFYEQRVDVRQDRLVGAQAVPRWKHRSGRVVEGDELIALAGTAEMGFAVTEWMLSQVADHVRKWRAARLDPLPVSVKLSLGHVAAVDMPRLVSGIADGMYRYFVLDMQQVAVLDAMQPADLRAIASVRDMGVRLALDRFGSGHSSVSQLRRLAVDEIKLDPVLMDDVLTDKGAAIALGVADLAGRLGVTCVATGLQDLRQLEFLRRHSWDLAQGVLFGEPLSGIDYAVRCLARIGKSPAA